MSALSGLGRSAVGGGSSTSSSGLFYSNNGHVGVPSSSSSGSGLGGLDSSSLGMGQQVHPYTPYATEPRFTPHSRLLSRLSTDKHPIYIHLLILHSFPIYTFSYCISSRVYIYQMGGFAGLGGGGSGMGNNDDYMNHMDLNFANSLGGLDLNLNMDDNDPLLRAIGGLTSTSPTSNGKNSLSGMLGGAPSSSSTPSSPLRQHNPPQQGGPGGPIGVMGLLSGRSRGHDPLTLPRSTQHHACSHTTSNTSFYHTTDHTAHTTSYHTSSHMHPLTYALAHPLTHPFTQSSTRQAAQEVVAAVAMAD